MRTRIAALPLALLAAVAPAQPPPAPTIAPPAAAVPAEDVVRVALETGAGRIVLALDRGRAPVTTANFLRYVDSKRLDGSQIYRAMKMGAGGLIQGGVRDGNKLYPPIAHEPTSKTGLKHLDGTISMARAAPGTARNDFFITVGAVPGFDAGGDPSTDNLGFAAFGRVVEGMDVVRRLLDSPTSPTLGGEVMKGQMLDPPVKIVTARRVKP